MPLDAIESDLIERIHALLDGSKNLSRAAAARAVPAKELDKARADTRAALWQSAGMSPDALCRTLDAKMPTLPRHAQRRAVAVVSIQPITPDRITPDLIAAKDRLTRAILDVLARVEGKAARM